MEPLVFVEPWRLPKGEERWKLSAKARPTGRSCSVFWPGSCAPEAARAGRLQKLSDFFSGWIFTQMETADALPYHST